jgi:alginate O-acetyltransferase complex protein AlgI
MVSTWLSQLSDMHQEGLVFCSGGFLAFFAVVFALYWALPWERPRVALLLGASFAFYATWSKQLAAVVFVSATVDYFLARFIAAIRSSRGRGLLVAVSVAGNLGLLCYFKYVNFFLASLEQFLHRCGATSSFRSLAILAPIGISFYTFEAISYVVDVYRGKVHAERRLDHFLLFILFFPHLVSGPIVRARDFLPQIARRKRWDWLRLQLGVCLFLMGLFKKWVLADRMALFADPVFADPAAFRASAQWLAVVAYAVQIYCDFSGYTDMAIGTAHLLGYKLAANFNLPYLAVNVSEFWRRWHISLSSWLRDYLFIPLGGSRRGPLRTCVNLLVVMALGGLWHGASWTFVAWGVLHGLLLIVHRVFQGFCVRQPHWQRLLHSALGTATRMGLTLLCVSLGWVFFRAQTFAAAATLLRGLFSVHPGRIEPMNSAGFAAALIVLVLGHALGYDGRWRKLLARVPGPVLGLAYAVVVTLCLVLVPPTDRPFIYFQF